MSKTNKLQSKKHVLRAGQLLQQAWATHQAGHIQEAESQYLAILQKYPNYPEAIHLLGIVARQINRFDIAIVRFEQTLAIKPNFAEAHNNLGDALQIIGKTEGAINHFKQAITLKPDFAEAHYNLGNCLLKLEQTEEAINHFKQAITLKPDFAEAHNNLGNGLLKLEQTEEAINHFKQAITLKPDFAEAHNNLGNGFQKQEHLEDACIFYKQAITLKPDFVEAYYNLGNSLLEHGKLEDALTHFRQVISLKPDFIDAYIQSGIISKALGQMEDSIAYFEQALTQRPDCASAYYHLAAIDPKEEQVSKIETLLSSPVMPDKEAMYCHFALGMIHNSIKSYSKAFVHFQIGNSINRKNFNYDSKKNADYVNQLIETFSANYFREKTQYGSDSELPVFILGMPRSGTTLVEQIASSHPQVYGAGELSKMRQIEQAIIKQFNTETTYPECMSLFNESLTNKYATEYLNELANYNQNAIRITDKMPGNFLYIGIIKTLFPRARIIHCKRNALDTCVSIFLTNFKHHAYSKDLMDLGQYYLDYERLMAHWLKLFTDEIFEVQYEDLVMNQESISHQLIEYLGLEWDDRCLSFHENKRAVKTASNLQVRQPIYTKSIERWKRYEEHLHPLIAVLQH